MTVQILRRQRPPARRTVSGPGTSSERDFAGSVVRKECGPALDRDPIVAGSSASMVNGALDAWVRAAAIELPRELRINAVSPGVIEEAMEAFAPFFRGFEPVPAARAALAYAKSVEGARTGQVYRVD